MFRYPVVFVVLSLFSTALAQQSKGSRVIAVNVASSDPRIQSMLPRLRDQAAKAVEDSAKKCSSGSRSGFRSSSGSPSKFS